MSRSSPFSVRGRRALAVVRDERDLSVLTRQLDRLGMTIVNCELDNPMPPSDGFDVVLVDSDIIPAKMDWRRLAASRIPLIALVGTETPSRLKGLLELEPSCFLVKPLRSAGLYSALVLAFDQARRRDDASRRLERLEAQVRARRVVLAALLRIMRSRDLSEPEAFAWIRRSAMEQRTTIEGLSARIMARDNPFQPSSLTA
jgi:AmiR/NasT family two-component response regulator